MDKELENQRSRSKNWRRIRSGEDRKRSNAGIRDNEVVIEVGVEV